jgi:hypothetical protein
MNRSTVGTALKNKERIFQHVNVSVPAQFTIVNREKKHNH